MLIAIRSCVEAVVLCGSYGGFGMAILGYVVIVSGFLVLLSGLFGGVDYPKSTVFTGFFVMFFGYGLIPGEPSLPDSEPEIASAIEA